MLFLHKGGRPGGGSMHFPLLLVLYFAEFCTVCPSAFRNPGSFANLLRVFRGEHVFVLSSGFVQVFVGVFVVGQGSRAAVQ